jgi:hypothetical protein
MPDLTIASTPSSYTRDRAGDHGAHPQPWLPESSGLLRVDLVQPTSPSSTPTGFPTTRCCVG